MTNQPNPEYLSCPFCGGEPEVLELTTFVHENKWVVDCDKCGCGLYGANTKAEVVQSWNTRAPVPEPKMDPRIMRLLREIGEANHFTCPACGGHNYGIGQGWFGHAQARTCRQLVYCHDQHRTRCSWFGPYEEHVRSAHPDSSSQGVKS